MAERVGLQRLCRKWGGSSAGRDVCLSWVCLDWTQVFQTDISSLCNTSLVESVLHFRTGRFREANPKQKQTYGKPLDMPGHSVPLMALGGFLILIGFLAFNGGSEVSFPDV